MKECSKSVPRRLANANFSRRYFKGSGLDVGGKPDPLVLYAELFPLVSSIRTWDIEDGDAQYLESIRDCKYDFVHSSHCLEHLRDPDEGIRNWFRVLKPGGYLVITVPDEDLYEQGQFPSTFNKDHKWTFTVWKDTSWSDKSVNVIDLLKVLGEEAAIEKVELLDSTYRDRLPRYDQTLTPIAECGIEIIVRKRSGDEVTSKGNRVFLYPNAIDREVTVHLNQYRDDLKTLKENNAGAPPFQNDSDL
jgi:SAM-dependent methyltransferase